MTSLHAQNNPLSDSSRTITYLALGDSYTIGESVLPQDRYPVQLVERLKNEGFTIEEPHIIATTGWTTLDLTEAIELKHFVDSTFDLVSLLIGVNDQYQHKPFENYEPNFRKLLKTAVALAGGRKEHVFVISIPDYAFTPFGQKKESAQISRELDEYNRVSKDISDEYGITYFNITPISRLGLQDPTLVADDGLHPSDKMYSKWVDQMLGEIIVKLQ